MNPFSAFLILLLFPEVNISTCITYFLRAFNLLVIRLCFFFRLSLEYFELMRVHATPDLRRGGEVAMVYFSLLVLLALGSP